MKKSLKVTLLSLCGIVAVLLAAVLVFVGIYFTRIQTMNSIEKLSDYDDGYNLYRMEVKYDYSLDDVINYGIKDNQTMIDAILKDALPLLPVKIEAPSFGCTAFTLTDADGDVTDAVFTEGKYAFTPDKAQLRFQKQHLGDARLLRAEKRLSIRGYGGAGQCFRKCAG